MTLVAELNRLLFRDVSLRAPRGAMDLGGDPQEAGDDEDGAEDADARDRVRAWVEDLGHRQRTRATYLVKYFT
jgi:hypothetical protein